jgi:hypothetical protein
MSKNNITRIYIWSGPRNISTALMYSFAQRSDTIIYDEPLYAHYLTQTRAREYHPGSQDIIGSMENNGEKVIEMMKGSHDKPVVFFKNMTHHLLNLDRAFMNEAFHIILTRNPVEMIPSFAKVIKNPKLEDLGYDLHLELLHYFQKMNIDSIVIDSKDILINPEFMLKKICQCIGIPFYRKMLKWHKGSRPEDGIWAEYWYGNIHKSTGFMKYKVKTEPFPEELNPLLNSCLPYYNELLKFSI